jgi:hypothetical protein
VAVMTFVLTLNHLAEIFAKLPPPKSRGDKLDVKLSPNIPNELTAFKPKDNKELKFVAEIEPYSIPQRLVWCLVFE